MEFQCQSKYRNTQYTFLRKFVNSEKEWDEANKSRGISVIFWLWPSSSWIVANNTIQFFLFFTTWALLLHTQYVEYTFVFTNKTHLYESSTRMKHEMHCCFPPGVYRSEQLLYWWPSFNLLIKSSPLVATQWDCWGVKTGHKFSTLKNVAKNILGEISFDTCPGYLFFRISHTILQPSRQRSHKNPRSRCAGLFVRFLFLAGLPGWCLFCSSEFAHFLMTLPCVHFSFLNFYGKLLTHFCEIFSCIQSRERVIGTPYM